MTLFTGISYFEVQSLLYILIYDDEGALVSKTKLHCAGINKNADDIYNFIIPFIENCSDYIIIGMENESLYTTLKMELNEFENVLLYYINYKIFEWFEIFDSEVFSMFKNEYMEAFTCVILGAFKYHNLLREHNILEAQYNG